jgi:hypothetical protein
LQLLREAGIHVEVGTLEPEIREFLAPYLYGASPTEGTVRQRNRHS